MRFYYVLGLQILDMHQRYILAAPGRLSAQERTRLGASLYIRLSIRVAMFTDVSPKAIFTKWKSNFPLIEVYTRDGSLMLDN